MLVIKLFGLCLVIVVLVLIEKVHCLNSELTKYDKAYIKLEEKFEEEVAEVDLKTRQLDSLKEQLREIKVLGDIITKLRKDLADTQETSDKEIKELTEKTVTLTNNLIILKEQVQLRDKKIERLKAELIEADWHKRMEK